TCGFHPPRWAVSYPTTPNGLHDDVEEFREFDQIPGKPPGSALRYLAGDVLGVPLMLKPLRVRALQIGQDLNSPGRAVPQELGVGQVEQVPAPVPARDAFPAARYSPGPLQSFPTVEGDDGVLYGHHVDLR